MTYPGGYAAVTRENRLSGSVIETAAVTGLFLQGIEWYESWLVDFHEFT